MKKQLTVYWQAKKSARAWSLHFHCWVILMICEVLLNLMDSLDNLHLSPFADADYILIKDIIELFLIRKYCFYNFVRKWLNKTNSKACFHFKKVCFFFLLLMRDFCKSDLYFIHYEKMYTFLHLKSFPH